MPTNANVIVFFQLMMKCLIRDQLN